MKHTNQEARCPACLRTLNGAAAIGRRATPRAGDLSVCCYCTALLEFNTDLTVRLLSREVFESLSVDMRERLEGAQRVVRWMTL